MIRIFKYTGKTIKLSLEEKGIITLLKNNNSISLNLTEFSKEEGEFWNKIITKENNILKILSIEECLFLSKNILNMFNINFIGPIQNSLNDIIINKINKNHMILSISITGNEWDEFIKRFRYITKNITFILPRNEAKRFANKVTCIIKRD